jgi:hypothetical protein
MRMSTARKLNLVSVDDYLANELISPRKHEYLGGVVYAMAGAKEIVSKEIVSVIVSELTSKAKIKLTPFADTIFPSNSIRK